MSDLVAQLKQGLTGERDLDESLIRQAADEIERLTTLVAGIEYELSVYKDAAKSWWDHNRELSRARKEAGNE